ncbi:MAG TPA: amidohydrolase family protein, partial [Actinomycetota bacterium]|nr:amidohydrolase family protein [Actinomycetota bacterium]
MTSPPSAAGSGGSGALRASSVVTLAGGPVPRRGRALNGPQVVSDGVVGWRDGRIVYAGPASGWDGPVDERFEARTIVPGFVDCHTHLPFVGWRAEEFEARLAGATYRELHAEGGIYRSARLMAEASDEEVLAFCRPLVAEMLDHGTTAFETKTGYGLSVERELRQARLAVALAAESPQTVVHTLLACHAVPRGMERQAWVDAVCAALVPRVAAEGLAGAVDVYVEDIAFSVGDLEVVAAAADHHGLALRCHADQLGPSGAAEAAVRFGALSADHLNHLSGAGIEALGAAPTAAVLLPSSSAFLGAPPPPARRLVGAGAAVAVATDFNPGTSPALSMPEA